MPPEVKASTHCTVLKLFTWYAYMTQLRIHFGDYFLGFFFFFFNNLYFEKSFGLIKPCIQVRHAQGIHNVEGEKDHDAYLSYDLFDANITPLGWKQVAASLIML